MGRGLMGDLLWASVCAPSATEQKIRKTRAKRIDKFKLYHYRGSGAVYTK